MTVFRKQPFLFNNIVIPQAELLSPLSFAFTINICSCLYFKLLVSENV